MARKINTNKMVALLAVLCMITSAFVGSTLAKYTTTASGEDTARVAKWAFDIGDNTTLQETFTFDLFKTIKDTNGADEDDVKAGTGNDHIIAPGTSGEFKFTLTNKSEVTANYGIKYEVTNNSNIPVEFSVDNGTTWKTSLDEVVAGETTKLAMDNGTDSTKDITVKWRWAYEGTNSENFKSSQTDTTDTALGKETTNVAKLTVKATVTVTQVD